MIETTDIRVDYGDLTAVVDVSLEIEPGEIHGLIGPNGAGKTSLIRVLATLREPTYGEARIGGLDTVEHVADVRRLIGYMPDLAPVYGDLRCWEFLDLFARAYFVSRQERRRRMDACLEIVDLESKRDAMAGTLSRGMTQRLVLAKTLLHDPSVLLLDEPASGLDPMSRIDLRRLLQELARDGKSIIISSHILNELSAFCTSVGIMDHGRLVVHGRIDEILARLNAVRRMVIETLADAAALAARLETHEEITGVSVDGRSCEFQTTANDETLATLLADLVGEGIRVIAFHERRRGVEDIMLQFGGREGAAS